LNRRISVDPASYVMSDAIYQYRNEFPLTSSFEEWIENHDFSEYGYLLKIHWAGNSVQSIMSQFERWLRVEARNHAEEMCMGKRTQIPYEPLKQLAALRFKKLGFTFGEAKEFLSKKLGFTVDEDGEFLSPKSKGERVIPYYRDESGWSRAILAAKKRLAEFTEQMSARA
jgi:hypothetical protein